MEVQHSNIKGFTELFLGIFLISMSGVLVRYISLGALDIIVIRSILAAVTLYIYCRIKGYRLRYTERRYIIFFLVSSFFLAAHWVTYFYSLKISTVAVAMLSLYTYPALAALLEPLLLKQSFRLTHLFLGLLVVAGLYFLVPADALQATDMTWGVILGLISALLWALRLIYSKRNIYDIDPSVVMFYQLSGTIFFLFPVLFLIDYEQAAVEWAWLLFMGIMTTAAGHTFYVSSLKQFSVTTASILSGILPILGIIWAYFLLREVPDQRVFIGGSIILSTVFIEAFLQGMKARRTRRRTF